MSDVKAKLTPKQQRFVQEYLIDLNATQAAIRAGYSANTAKDIACENLAKPNIQEAIQTAMKKREKKTEITAERVLKELGKIAFADLNSFVEVSADGKITVKPSNQIDGTVLSEISESVTQNGRTRKVKLHDKMKALELIGRHLAMFVDKQEIKIEKTEEDKQTAVNQLKEMLKKADEKAEAVEQSNTGGPETSS
ncbi:terminase small subunit [Paenibacillus oleatilyticus]|uniref:terminase small subunit n=1 Tax=Paenibacillus oleatilyticus TaxID=2594886 RepID=UPI001C200B74|nr:terminase small subunit [Paenibacillus oleatilyticus]MBU7314063.1 terminase small subunit [Paenibacillus oleatilyticus]